MVDEDSNFGFGEGGAGTFSDWKTLYPFEERGDVRRVMEILAIMEPILLFWSSPSACRNRQIPGVIVQLSVKLFKNRERNSFTVPVTGSV